MSEAASEGVLRDKTTDFQEWFSVNLAFLSAFLLLRIYEFFLVGNIHLLPDNSLELEYTGVIYDLIFAVKLIAVVSLLFLLLKFISRKVAALVLKVSLCLAIVIQLCLIQYFSVTLIPLGSDLFGYSFSEIKTTVNSSGGFEILTIIPFALFTGLFFVAMWLFKKVTFSKVFAYSFIVISFLLILFSRTAEKGLPQKELDKYLTLNKSAYFTGSIYSMIYSSGEVVEYKMPEYPLVKNAQYNDVLGKYLNKGDQQPNLVFIIVEGLGRSFTGAGAEHGGFTPFLDSLALRGLFWENFLSTTGRTFGVLPSLFGSLPFGDKGFLEMGNKMPRHHTLISLLKENGYYTSYYYGGNSNFDLQDVFMESEKVDFLLDENNFGPQYQKLKANSEGFSWGYADKDLFKRSLEVINDGNHQPRLDIYLTLNTHEPFRPPHPEVYLKKVEERVKSLKLNKERTKICNVYKKQFSTLLYLDESVKYFIQEYKKREDFGNTVFVITGDHRMIPIPHSTQIDKFRVPLIIYSPLVKKPETFSSVSSHADVTPTIISHLQRNYGLSFPSEVAWLSDGIDDNKSFRNTQGRAFMRNKNELTDYLDGEYFLSNDQLFQLTKNLDLEPLDDEGKKGELKKKFEIFKMINKYVCENDMLLPREQKLNTLVSRTAFEDSIINIAIKNKLTTDQVFLQARDLAFGGNRKEARVLCNYILENSPNYHDVRILKSRTFAWDKEYDEARKSLNETLRRSPRYSDALQALCDVEYWAENYQEAIETADKGISLYPENEVFLIKKAKASIALKKRKDAKALLEQALAINGANEEALKLLRELY